MKHISRIIFLLVLGLFLSVLYFISNNFTTHEKSSSLAYSAQKSQNIEITPISQAYKYGEFDFRDFAFIDDHKIWSVGYDGHDPQRIFYSTDGGLHWEAKAVKTNGFTLTSINFVDSENGWAVGGHGLIIHTSSGGESWVQSNRTTEADLTAVNFLNTKVGFIAGSNATIDTVTRKTTYGIKILNTIDGGNNWRTVYSDDQSHTVFQLEVLTELTAAAVIDGRFVLKTDDGGATWQKITLPSGRPMSIKFSKDRALWVVGDRGCFYRSTDQGSTWQLPTGIPESLLHKYWWSIDFMDARKGIAVGDQGACAITFDGGKTWAECGNNIKEHLRKVKVYDDSGIIIGSEKIYKLRVS